MLTVVNNINILSKFLKQNTFQKNIPYLEFEGFGSLAKYLLDPNSKEYITLKNSLIELNVKKHSVETLLDSITNSLLTSFFTPDELIQKHVESIKSLSEKNNLEINNILEPSAGNGKYLKHLRKAFPKANIYAIEKDILTSAILKYNYFDDPKIKIENTSFENIDATKFPKKYDLIISNIPFGDFGVFDPTVNEAFTKQIHSYFFVKALQLSNPNTISSFITSKGFLDASKNQNIRNYVNDNANFLGAFRLPNHTFKNAKTSVVTDLVYIQKGIQPRGFQTPSFTQNNFNIFSTTEYKNDYSNLINEYYKNNDHIFGKVIPGGMYRKDDYTITSKKSIKEISENLLSISKNFEIKKFNVSQENEIETNKKNILKEKTEIKNINEETNNKLKHLNIGNLYIDESFKTFVLNDQRKLSYLPFPKTIDLNRIASIINLRDLYNSLKEEGSQNINFDKKLIEFNDNYDLFVFQYQELNLDINQQIISFDSQREEILDFETLDKKTRQFIKGPVFFKDYYIEKIRDKKPLKNINEKEALLLSLNKSNTVDITYISKLLNISNKEFIDRALKKELIYLNPLFDKNYNYTGDFEYTTKELFFSGRIQKKIDFYKSQDLLNTNIFFDKNYLDKIIQELEEIKPQIIPFEQLYAKIGESWIELDIIKKFVKDTYHINYDIKYNKSLDRYYVSKYEDWGFAASESLENMRNTFSFKAANNRYYTFENILEANLNSQIPTINKTVSLKPLVKVIDKPSVITFENNMKKIDNDFFNYISNNEELKTYLEDKYHKLYNSDLKPNLTSKHLTFDNLTFEPYQFQLDASMQIIQNNGGVVDHKVGWGKTITAAMIAMKLKEMNIIKKSMMLCLPTNISDIAKNIKNAYPTIDMLVADHKSFKPANINNFLQQIRSKNWDMVLISHTNYQLINQDKNIQKEIIEEQLDNVNKDLEALDLSYDKISMQMKKGLIKRKINLGAKLQYLNHKFNSKRNTKYTFSDLGIGHLFVDESHSFKNLSYTTRHNRVAGLNTSEGSDKSYNLLVGIRTLQKKYNADKGTTFLSGTTLSNSITELYVLFKYLIPNKLIELNIKSFDQWVKVFGEKTLEVEKGMSGSYLMKERFRRFKKVPELSNLYTQIAHVSHNSKHIKKPSINNNFETLNPYPIQKSYFQDLENFAATSDTTLLNDPNKVYNNSQLKATALIAMNYMIKASLDMRIVNDVYFDDDPNNRVRKCAKNIVKIYNESDHFKGTQLVFSDRSTPKKNEFDIYNELKRVLSEEYNIPSDEIQFIHDFDNNHKKRDKLINDFNKGNVRIIFGSTSKLGTGLNIQERGVGMHHFDIPYKPSDFEQRIGRFSRKGNIYAESHFNNIVENFLYATTGSIDVKLFDLNNIKNNFINQIKNNTIEARIVDEGAIDMNGSISYRDFLMQITDNDDFAKIQELEKERDNLNTQKLIQDKRNFNFKNQLLNLEANLNNNSNTLIKLEENLKLFNDVFPLKKEIKKNENGNEEEISNRKIDLQKYSLYEKNNTPKEIFDKFQQKVNETLKNDKLNVTLFNYDKLEIVIRGTEIDNYRLLLKTPNNITFAYGSSQMVKNVETMLNYPLNCFAKIEGLINNYKNMIEKDTYKIESIKNVENNNFTKKDEKRLKEIDSEIKILEKNISDEMKKGRDKGKSI